MRRETRLSLTAVAALILAACDGSATNEPGPAASSAALAVPEAPVESAANPAATEAAVTSSATPPSPVPLPTLIPAPMPARLEALGTEPFWNARVGGAQIVYSTPENQQGQSIPVARSGSAWRGTLAGKPFELSITRGRCNDGMSDTVYAFKAQLVVEGERRDGCARART